MKQKKASILIVDDDESICRTMSLILESEGYKTQVAYTGKEALERSKTTSFNVALLDIKLPDIEGTKLLKKLNQTAPQIIRIMVTGYPNLDNAVEALNGGADAYLVKPVNPDYLIKIIRDKLQQQQKAETVTEESITTFLEARTKQLLDGLR